MPKRILACHLLQSGISLRNTNKYNLCLYNAGVHVYRFLLPHI